MSHRTAPYYNSTRSVHSRLFPVRVEAPVCIFLALEKGRFDLVRQAVEADASMLSKRGGTNGTATPLEHALCLAQGWLSLLAHCERSGAAVSAPDLTAARKRVAIVAAMIEWLAGHPSAPQAPRNALHAAIACNYASVARLLVAREPTLVSCLADARRRTPLHTAMRLAARVAPAEMLAYVRLLLSAGASFEVRDIDGCTPLHALVIALASVRRARTLERAHAHRPSLRAVQSTVEFALLEGADLFALNRCGVTPLDLAVREGLDYAVFVNVGNSIYENICTKRQQGGPCGKMGMFEDLPHDIVLRVMSMLSPRDAVTGIGASCKTMNKLLRNEYLWKHLSFRDCMARANAFRRREM